MKSHGDPGARPPRRELACRWQGSRGRSRRLLGRQRVDVSEDHLPEALEYPRWGSLVRPLVQFYGTAAELTWNWRLNSLFLWTLFSLSLGVYNKWLFAKEHYNFQFPLFTTTCHWLIQFSLACLIVAHFAPGLTPSKIPSGRDVLIRLLPCGIATGLDIGLSNSSLKVIPFTA